MHKELRAKVSLLNPAHFLALGFGSGLSPKMPGTAGTLAGMPFVVLLSLTPPSIYISCAVIGFVVGVKICQITSDAMQVHDDGSIVWDEIIGIVVTFAFIPINWINLILGFALFRFFDIVKPWPISVLDKKVHGGFGIMVDDFIKQVMDGKIKLK